MKRKVLNPINFLLMISLLLIFLSVISFHSCYPKNNNNVNNIVLHWKEQFGILHGRIKKEYPYTQWKGINWDTLYEIYQPLISDAETNNDTNAYYLALRQYIFSIPDGHVKLLPNNLSGTELYEEVKYKNIGGSYGLALIGLDDGQVVAHIITNGSPADQAGMNFGVEILEWNGQSIETALVQTPIIWADSPPSTNEVRRIEQYRFIGRGPVGSSVTVTFKNPGASNGVTAILTAVPDDYETLTLTDYRLNWEENPPVVQFEILPSGYGYVKITLENDVTIDEFRKAIEEFVNKDVPGVIIDLRRNDGGADDVSAQINGFFYEKAAHFEYVCLYNYETGLFEITRTIEIEPQSPYYGGPVIVLVGPGCRSSGEGPAMGIKKLPQGLVIGFYATNGIFGITGPAYDMPKGQTVRYPYGRSLDENENIQIEGDKNGVGGIVPDIRVPLNYETIYKAFIQGLDVELEFAIEELHQTKRRKESGVKRQNF
jgi:carboxyl-terminal processing protease